MQIETLAGLSAEERSKKEDLTAAIADELSDELDARGVSASAFGDSACDRFAERIIDRFALVGRRPD